MKPDIGLPRRGFSPVFDPLAVAEFIHDAHSKLKAMGIEIEASSDFEAYESTYRKLSGKAEAVLEIGKGISHIPTRLGEILDLQLYGSREKTDH